LELDLLGHDDPTVIKMLHDLTGIDPLTVPLDDRKTMSLFSGTEALGVEPKDIGCKTGTLGIPEFGTKFVRQMLLETKPESFADLVRISGLSHGTNVWVGNAQELISNGTIKIKDSISTRDGIMIYLINKGMPKKLSFNIMERVRKGKKLTPEDEEAMLAAGVPKWYIDSCNKISYMFPKAHATAYVMMAYRIAYFKINYPREYYASYFSVRAIDDFDYLMMCRGAQTAREALAELSAKGNDATAKEKNTITVLELVLEFYARGFEFERIDLYKSDAKNFLLTPNGLLPPLSSIQGLGITAAQSIVAAREEGEFFTIEDLRLRTTANKTVIDLLREYHILDGIPETDQLSLF